MRLPLSKVWRAFPELDGFEDADCVRYVAEARRSRWRSGLALLVFEMAGGGIGCLAALLTSVNLADAITPGAANLDAVWSLLLVALVAAPQLAIIVGLLWLRDLWLRSGVRARLNTMACPGCRYSLLGLTALGEVGNQRVICPECGRHVELTPEMLGQLNQLGAPSRALSPSPPSSA